MNQEGPPAWGEVEGPDLSAQAPDAGLDLRAYMGMFRRRWPWILSTGILVMVTVTALQWNRVSYPVYTAEVLIQRLPQGNTMGGLGFVGSSAPVEITSELEILRTGRVLGSVVDAAALRVILPSDPGLRSRVFRRTDVSPEAVPRAYFLQRRSDQVTLVASGQVVTSADPLGVIRGPGFVLELNDPTAIPSAGLDLEIISRTDAIRRLDRSFDAEQPRATNLILVQYSGGDPVRAAEVASALALAYQEQTARRAREDATRRREFLAERLVNVADSLRQAQDELLAFQAGSGMLNPQSEGQRLSVMLVQAQEDLRTLRAQESTLNDLLENLNNGGRDGQTQMLILSGDMLPGAPELYKRLRDYEDRRSNLTDVGGRTANAPSVLLLDSLIVETKVQMRLTVEQTIRLVRQDVTAAENRVNELRTQVNDVPERGVGFGRLEQRIEAIQSMYAMLGGRYYEAQVTEAVEAGDVQIVDPAIPPSLPSGIAGRKVPPPLSLLAGVLFGCLGVVVFQKFDTRIRSSTDARIHSGVEIVGEIPTLTMGVGRRLSLAGNDGTLESEAFRMLRTNLRFVRAEGLGCFVVTSPAVGDGKSLVSSNLAVALAQEGRRVLLIDADLRRPVQHEVFGLKRSPGLANLVVGETKEVYRRTEYGVHVLTAGSAVPNPAELIGSESFRRYLRGARKQYDMVIIDTPPLLVVSDSSVICPYVDGVLLVVRHEQTQRGALAGAAYQLLRSRSNILGVVVNDISRSAGSRFGYGDGYYYYNGLSEYLSDANSNGAAT